MAKIINFSDFNLPVETYFEFKDNRRSSHGMYIFTCRHFRFEVDEGSREVRCKECGEIIDPFDIMIQFAVEQRRFFTQVAKNRAAIDEFEKIQLEWSLTVREKRRITKAMKTARIYEKNEEEKK